MFNMSKEEKFNFDIANLKKYSNDEISQSEMINIIKDNMLKGV